MNRGLEFQGKNVKLAVEKACSELNLSPDVLDYQVISNGSSGIFGLVGVKKARIRVALGESGDTGSKKMNSKKQDLFSNDSLVDSGIKDLVDEAFNGTKKRDKQSPPKTSPRESSFFNKKENKTRRPEPKKHQPYKKGTLASNVPDKKEGTAIADETLKLGTEALQKILDLITTGATISVVLGSGRVLFNVVGGNSGVLIGKRGQNLEAIQYIIDKIVNKHSETRVRVRVDVEGYLESRRVNLIKLAERLAEKTKKTGRPSTLGQMNAQDRRTVHISLKSHKGIRTQSVGNGYYRKLVIFPKKNNHRKRKYTESASAEK